MFTSSLSLYLVVALGATGFTGNVATAYVIDIPDGPMIEITQNVNSSEPVVSDMITYNGTHSFTINRHTLEQVTCPCSILGHQVPNPTYLTDILGVIVQVAALFPTNLELFCKNLALLFLQIYILPNSRCWAVCAGCQFCHNPGCSIWILVQLNLFGGIIIKICN